ncbi:serine protease [Streptomyces axinellae]|uniref:Serine protease n=1 Tax=Streptomyces axinellae TaxID=552788 RepID=A0ABN3QVT8_9ACTN
MSAVRRGPALAHICDLAGRPRGTGFPADALGTLVTSHEAVDGLSRVVVQAGGRSCLAESGDITPVPEWDLALIRTRGLGLAPLVIGGERAHPGGSPVDLRIDEPLRATLVGTTAATYTSTERYHPLAQVLELAVPDALRVQLRLSRPASGAPVLDAVTGAVLGVLGTALHAPGRAAVFAVPLYATGMPVPEGPLRALLRHNAAGVPGFGPDLNLAGALRLSATSVGPAVERCAHAATRPGIAIALKEFANGNASVLALLGDPGTGRTTELAAFAARRIFGAAPVPAAGTVPAAASDSVPTPADGAEPAPTVWLRGADLHDGDGSVREAVGRALASAGRILAASHHAAGLGVWRAQDPREANPDVVARLSRTAGRPLLVLLDSPEEMPPQLAQRLRRWITGTASWLRAAGARMAVACRPEFWGHAGPLFPREMLHVPPDAWAEAALPQESAPSRKPEGSRKAAGSSAGVPIGVPFGALSGVPSGEVLPGCVRIGDLPEREAVRVRSVYGLRDGALAPEDEGHPLAIRMLAQVHAAQGGSGAGALSARQPARVEIFSAYLDLLCLRVALRMRSGERRTGTAAGPVDVRRLATRVAGRFHQAARHCLGPGQGELEPAAFEELFPRSGGWASAVLAEGALVRAGEGYRFADEEFADWIQGRHLELDAALDALVHHRSAATLAPVPRHRAGPVVHSLLLCGHRDGHEALAPRLRRLADALVSACACASASDGGDESGNDDEEVGDEGEGEVGDESVRSDEAVWWSAHLLRETLLRVPDAGPYTEVLRVLARFVVRTEAEARKEGDSGYAPYSGFGPWFWRRLSLPVADKAELLRLLLPADPPFPGRHAPSGRPSDPAFPGCPDAASRERFLDVVGGLLAAEPQAMQPVLCEWFGDPRPLRLCTEDVREADGPAPTVAAAAQALLYVHRGRALDELLEVLVEAAHPRADELLAELVHEEPSGVCRAVRRWARAPRDGWGGRDRRDGRWGAAATYGLRAARRVRSDADRELLRGAALALLRECGGSARGDAALALLVRDPASRSRYVDAALRRFAETGDPELTAALGTALNTHPEPVFTAFSALLTGPVSSQEAPLRASLARVLGAGQGPLRDELLDLLLAAERELPVLETALDAVVRGGRQRRARRSAASGGDGGFPASGGNGERAASGGAEEVMASGGAGSAGASAPGTGTGTGPAWASVPGAESGSRSGPGLGLGSGPGTASGSGPSAVEPAEERWPEGELVRRIGLRMAVVPQGVACFDRALAGLAREVPGFAGALRAWVTGAPDAWAVLGPGARRMCEVLGTRT